MRILIIGLKAPIGGVEHIITDYVKHFPKEGNEYDFAVFSTDENLENLIASANGNVLYLPSRMKRYAEYKRQVKKIFEAKKYDVVWCSYSGLTNIDFLVFAKKYNVTVRIAHSHVSALSWNGRIMKYLVPYLHYKNKKRIKNFATNFWACSSVAGKFMFPQEVFDDIEIKHNGIEVDSFLADQEAKSKAKSALNLSGKTVVGHIGRCCKEKNQKFLLDVFAEYKKKDPSAHLLIVGDGELFEETKAYANSIALGDSVSFAGYQKDTVSFLHAMDVFVQPSLNEGLPITLIEAQACGIRCIASTGVSSEADVSGYIDFIPLDAPVSEWVNAISKCSKETIPNPTELVKAAGYDISVAAKELYNQLSK